MLCSVLNNIQHWNHGNVFGYTLSWVRFGTRPYCVHVMCYRRMLCKCLCAHVCVWASVLCTFVCVSASECVCGHDLHCTCSSPGHPGNDLCSSSLDRPSNNLHNLSGLSQQSSTQTIPTTIYTIFLDYPDNHLHRPSQQQSRLSLWTILTIIYIVVLYTLLTMNCSDHLVILYAK